MLLALEKDTPYYGLGALLTVPLSFFLVEGALPNYQLLQRVPSQGSEARTYLESC